MQQKTAHAQPLTGPTAAHERLHALIGAWHTEGRQIDGPIGREAKITAVDTYEWLTGHMFVVHRFEGMVGDLPAACIEIIGYDEANDRYPVNTFYNNGITRSWQLRDDDGNWKLEGNWEIEGRVAPVRCTVNLADNDGTMRSRWECCQDDTNWIAFWELEATKVR